MIKRRSQLLKWAGKNFPIWPAPFDTTPDGPNPQEVAAEWVMMHDISSLPVLRCRLGGCGPITSTDYFYHKRNMVDNAM